MSKLTQHQYISRLYVVLIFLSTMLLHPSISLAQQLSARQQWDKTYRPYIIQNVLNRIADEAEQQGFIGWREEVQAHLEQLTTIQLNEVQSAQTYNEVTTIIRGGEINPQQLGAYTSNSEVSNDELSSGPQLGDKEQDLVYTPLPPCRIVDTRVRGGKFAARQTRSYSVNGNTSTQGGTTNCGVPDGVNEPAAVVLNITSSKGVGNGFLTAYPLGTSRPNASVLNYQTQDIANALVLKSAIAGLNEIAVYTSASTHVIIDVMGYLRKPEGVLLAEINKLKALFAGVTRSGNLLRFTGMNVQIENGTGDTHGTPNGLGNLIVGYNQVRPNGSQKTGSHNLIVGNGHNYTSTGGLVAGANNTISGESSSVSGGLNNTVSARGSSVSGGQSNIASGLTSSVSGGQQNTASNTSSSVSGGQQNTASDFSSSVNGGLANVATGSRSNVSGGIDNTASGSFSSISGGQQNIASGESSSVSGGTNNTASGDDSSVSGGIRNTASGGASNVSAGQGNTASGGGSGVSGGAGNIAQGGSSSVSGGSNNKAFGGWSNVSGGGSRAAHGPSDWRAGSLFQDF